MWVCEVDPRLMVGRSSLQPARPSGEVRCSPADIKGRGGKSQEPSPEGIRAAITPSVRQGAGAAVVVVASSGQSLSGKSALEMGTGLPDTDSVPGW